MLDRVNIQNVNDTSTLLTLTLSDPSNGYIVKEIQGLGPVKATLHSSTFAGLDGERYHGSRKDIRNIVFTLGLKSTALSVQALRTMLYKTFMPQSDITMSFYMADNSRFDILGVVETCEPTMFSKEPDMTVSTICHSPDFISPVVGTVSGVTTNSTNNVEFQYSGTVPSGFTFTMVAATNISNTTITFERNGKLETLRSNLDMVAGDTLLISTVKGSRSAKVIRNGQTIASTALYSISNDAVWLELLPGLNKVRVSTETPGNAYFMEWKPRHGGL